MVKLLLVITGAYLVAKYIKNIWFAVPLSIVVAIIINIVWTVILMWSLPGDFLEAAIYGMAADFVWNPVLSILFFIIFRITRKKVVAVPATYISLKKENPVYVHEDSGNVHTEKTTTAVTDQDVTSTRKFCNQCGTQLPQDAKFCQGCGTELLGAVANNTASANLKIDYTNKTAERIIDGVSGGLSSGVKGAKKATSSLVQIIFYLLKIFLIAAIVLACIYGIYYVYDNNKKENFRNEMARKQQEEIDSADRKQKDEFDNPARKAQEYVDNTAAKLKERINYGKKMSTEWTVTTKTDQASNNEVAEYAGVFSEDGLCTLAVFESDQGYKMAGLSCADTGIVINHKDDIVVKFGATDKSYIMDIDGPSDGVGVVIKPDIDDYNLGHISPSAFINGLVVNSVVEIKIQNNIYDNYWARFTLNGSLDAINQLRKELHDEPPQQLNVSPSFDCNMSKSTVEKLICSNYDLAQLDRDLFEVYTKAKQLSADSELFKQQTKEVWLWRENNCRDVDCLRSWYFQQRSELHSFVGDKQYTDVENGLPENLDKSCADLCLYMSQRGELNVGITWQDCYNAICK